MDLRIAVACVAAGAGGAAFLLHVHRWTGRRRTRRALRASLHIDTGAGGSRGFDSTGFVLHLALQQSLGQAMPRNLLYKMMVVGSRRFPRKIAQAGLSSAVSVEGLCRARMLMSITLAGGFAIAGAVMSLSLACAGAVLGAACGWLSVARALDRKAKDRQRSMERHLSEVVDVPCLGLGSGLSFDRALSLYCDCFDTPFGREMGVALHEWEAGLSTREEALRALAGTYASPLLERLVDDIVRSMRFGSPLVQSMEALGSEARQAHKARVEEEVMRAPVKMMVPVGTLILPSMLILVMGPVLLDLMRGF